MTHADVKCAECGARLKVAEKLVGTMIQCPKCKEKFFAEVGDTYGLAGDSGSPQVIDRRAESDTAPTGAKPRPKSKAHARPKAETKAEREQRERLEKWAKKMDQGS
jgi:DNA-directed RNA polymerase subunit RPC12/RpoP